MARLFPRMWASREGDVCDEQGAYTKNFLQWCRDLENITPDQYVVAFQLLEQRCSTAELEGKDYWPPNYAGFKGLCRSRKAHQQYTPQLGYDRDTRNEKGKEGTAKLKDILAGAKIISVDEADSILDKAREESLKELFE